MQLGQGKDNTKIYISENPKLSSEIEKKIVAAVNLPNMEAKSQNEQES